MLKLHTKRPKIRLQLGLRPDPAAEANGTPQTPSRLGMGTPLSIPLPQRFWRFDIAFDRTPPHPFSKMLELRPCCRSVSMLCTVLILCASAFQWQFVFKCNELRDSALRSLKHHAIWVLIISTRREASFQLSAAVVCLSGPSRVWEFSPALRRSGAPPSLKNTENSVPLASF